jgi:alpha-tubulin suppressor-like RCC1 family protein
MISCIQREQIASAVGLSALFWIGCTVPNVTISMANQDGGYSGAGGYPSTDGWSPPQSSDAAPTGRQDGQASETPGTDVAMNVDSAPVNVGAVCGDQKCDIQENSTSCCDDCGCSNPNQVCLGNSCVGIPIDIAAGGDHTCVVLKGGDVLCWGRNSSGELGLPDGSSQRNSPVAVPNLSDVEGLAAGSDFTCARTSGGSVKCWGDNSAGQLGSASAASSAVPLDVPGVANVLALAAGRDFACAVTTQKTVFCWGNNAEGQLGRGSSGATGAPDTVKGVTSALSVATGSNFACALLDNYKVSCWGWNYFGQLGDGTTTPSPTAAATVSNLTNAIQVVATVHPSSLLSTDEGPHGPTATACARLLDSTVACWGDNSLGELGTSVLDQPQWPVTVAGLDPAIDLAAGCDFFCAVISSHSVKCWGSNSAGQLGTGATDPSKSPNTAVNLTDVTSVAAGAVHACALRKDGAVYCWGANYSGQLGNGTTVSSLVPIPVI